MCCSVINTSFLHSLAWLRVVWQYYVDNSDTIFWQYCGNIRYFGVEIYNVLMVFYHHLLQAVYPSVEGQPHGYAFSSRLCPVRLLVISV